MTISLDQLPTGVRHRLARVEEHPSGDLIACAKLRKARRCLSARENRVIRLLYDIGWQSRQVAAELKVSESRVSQIKQRSLSKLGLILETQHRSRAA